MFEGSPKTTMQQKCCCGCCSLSTGAGIALVISAIQATIVVLWNIELLLLLNYNDTNNPLHSVINIHHIDEFEVVHGLTLAAIGLNGFCLIFAIIAGRGNVTLSHGHMAFWDALSYVITLFDTGTTIFFAIKLQSIYAEAPELFLDSKPTKTLTYLTLLVSFSKGGVMLFFNIYLSHIVKLRGKEIDHDHSALALYIISHIAHCNRANEIPYRPMDPPPAYASSGPCYVEMPCSEIPRSDSSGSQWSLSYDAIQNMSREPPKYIPSAGNRLRTPMAIARALSTDPSIIPEVMNIHTHQNAVSPY